MYEDQALDLAFTSTRTRTLHSALLATVHAAAGNVDRACELAHAALDTADGVQSDRVLRRLATLQRQLQPHRDLAEVRDVFDRLATRPAGLRGAGEPGRRRPDALMTWIDPETWYRQLPTVHVAALALITDGEGRVLLVKDAHRQRWDLPGGMAEDGEPPDRAAVREVKEEVGLDLDVERLLIVDWASPRGQRERPLLVFVFDGGTLRDPQVALQRSELDDWRYATIGELDTLMPSGIAARIRRATQAAAGDTTTYLVNAAEPHQQSARR